MTDKHLVARFYSLFVEWAEFSRLIAGSGDFFFSNKGPREIGEVSETKAAENYGRHRHIFRRRKKYVWKETDGVT